MADTVNWFSEIYSVTDGTTPPSTPTEYYAWGTNHTVIPLRYNSDLDEPLFSPTRGFIYFDNNSKAQYIHDCSYVLKFNPYVLNTAKTNYGQVLSNDNTILQLRLDSIAGWSDKSQYHLDEQYRNAKNIYSWGNGGSLNYGIFTNPYGTIQNSRKLEAGGTGQNGPVTCNLCKATGTGSGVYHLSVYMLVKTTADMSVKPDCWGGNINMSVKGVKTGTTVTWPALNPCTQTDKSDYIINTNINFDKYLGTYKNYRYYAIKGQYETANIQQRPESLYNHGHISAPALICDYRNNSNIYKTTLPSDFRIVDCYMTFA